MSHIYERPASVNSEPGPILDAQKVAGAANMRGADVTYRVLDAPVEAAGLDRRNPPRKRTRLRCGKILDDRGRFLIECQIYDRTSQGAHLRLMNAVKIPRLIRFYDDEQGVVFEAEVIWRRESEVGIQFWLRRNGRPIRRSELNMLGGKYYAVP